MYRNTLIREESWEILSHIKTRHGYNFLLYFPHELLMNFRSIYIYIFVCMYLCMYLCIYVSMYVFVYENRC